MQKKSTTKGGRKGKAEGGSKARAVIEADPGDLAEMLSAVMNHPDMPAELYNHIGDWLGEQFDKGVKIGSAWYIRHALDRAREGGRDE